MTEIRPFTDSDAERAATLVREHLGVERYSADYLRWKLSCRAATPDGVPSPFALCAAEGPDIVGFASFFPYISGFGGMAWCIDDVVVHPARRRRGIFRGLMAEGLAIVDRGRDSSFLFSSPMAESGYRSLGYTPLFELSYRLHVPSWRSLLSGRLPLIGGAAGGALDHLRRRPRGPDAAIEVRGVERFPDGIGPDAFPGAVLGMNSHFLNWRFRDHPLHRYRCFVASRGGEITGWLAVSRANISSLRAVDAGTHLSLLARARDEFRDLKVPLVHLLAHQPPERERMTGDAGFFRWRSRWRPFGLYPRHVLLFRGPFADAGRVAAARRDGVFTMADANVGL